MNAAHYEIQPCPLCGKIEPPILLDFGDDIVCHVSDNILEVRQKAVGDNQFQCHSRKTNEMALPRWRSHRLRHTPCRGTTMTTEQTYERMRRLVDDAAALSFEHSGCCVVTVSSDEYSRVLRRCAEGTGPNEALKQLFARHGRSWRSTAKELSV